MVPHASDAATEMFHWQRYLYFRPWYAGKRVVDAASGEGYGSNYASIFAAQVNGIDISSEAVLHARKSYPYSQFEQNDVTVADYSDADLVVSFETIEHVPNPEAFLRRLLTCPGQIVISTPNRDLHSPGNRLKDKPYNKFHTIEWTPPEFATLVESVAVGRQVRFLSQENRWPGRIFEGLDPEAQYTIAVIGDGELPYWPRLGFSMPTCNETDKALETISTFARFYPGVLEFAIVCNATSELNLAKLREIATNIPHVVKLIESPENLGYGQGANLGLDWLLQTGQFDYIGVTNDDVLPAIDCLSDLAQALVDLENAGHNPGMIGPVSNEVAGVQKVEISPYGDYPGMIRSSNEHSRKYHSSATPYPQIRGLCFLSPTEAFKLVGGFDPRFGLGNFEDDDLNVRFRLAGYTLWRCDGAFLHHHGSSTFKSLNLDYQACINKNLKLFIDKWQVAKFDLPFSPEFESSLPLYIPFQEKRAA